VTYCLAIRLDEGIVFLSDTCKRTTGARRCARSDDSLSFDEHCIEADSQYLADIQQRFVRHLFDALAELPPIPWADG
jgi:predicted proteasome-type protease